MALPPQHSQASLSEEHPNLVPPGFWAIFRFWSPLAATWFMMATEGPFVAALVARLADPTFNLAAFGVAMTLGFLAEAPIIMLLSATTSLVRDRESLQRMRRFSLFMNVGVTLAMASILLPPIFDFLAYHILVLPAHVAELARLAVAMLLPWPAAIGFRRFHQGILISSGKTRLVAYGTLARLTMMSVTGFLLFLRGDFDGAVVGTAALSAGVTAESLATWAWARNDLRRLENTRATTPESVPTMGDIQRFYWPLALTPLINMAAQPMVTFFVGRGQLPIESLAVIPVVNSFGFVFRCSAMAFQEVVIALGRAGDAALASLRAFARILACVTSLALAAVVLTPAAHTWFVDVAGLSPHLVTLAQRAAIILIPTPAITTLIVWMHARMVMRKTTHLVSYSTLLEVAALALTLLLGIAFIPVPAVYIAMTAILLGRLTAASFLLGASHLFSNSPMILSKRLFPSLITQLRR